LGDFLHLVSRFVWTSPYQQVVSTIPCLCVHNSFNKFISYL